MSFVSTSDLTQLAVSRPDLSLFGPQSDHPWLAFDLSTGPTDLAAWLTRLPCPVIGIGDGEPALIEACDVLLEDDTDLPAITRNIENAPLAAMVLVQHLRASETLNLDDALTAESFAYATVQMGPEFQDWKRGAKDQPPLKEATDPILVSVEDRVEIRLNDPENRNAIGVTMRDALCEALDLALALDLPVSLTGQGRTFSVGGAIEEFGEVTDPATAHWIRTLRLPARRIAQLSPRLEVHVNGAAIGAGAEIAAFGNRVTASEAAWFQLPELKYGLIPGAGGTVSLPRRIGRHKTAWLALSMTRLRADQALGWGLIDDII